MSNSGIYQIRNTENGHIYIGSAVSISIRWNKHRHLLKKGKHHSKHLQSAWMKYGESSFEFSILERCDKQNLVREEQKYIDSLRPEYNVCSIAGSNLGIKLSAETKQKMSLVRIGMVFSDEHKMNLSKSHKGKPSSWKGKTPSEESRKKMSESHKGQVAWNKGRVTPDSTRQKISEANKGKTAWNKGKIMGDAS